MTRAQRLSPGDRREAIIEATIPLLVERGPDVSTRQIAAACGIAEGTLFRVFPSKDAILTETIRATLDPTEAIDELHAIDPAGPLAVRLREVVGILHARVLRVSSLVSALVGPRPGMEGKPHGPGHPHHPHGVEDRERLTAAVADVLAPDADLLDVDPLVAASFVRSFVLAAAHPMLGDGRLGDPDLTTRLLLRALRKELP
ncbi:DNA-binding transcriptional regulator, AcrR family [Raineyella antarctica]|uniref:DNA-binding transcriptional regulator, AcrR family n=1 Tax=Raineyella antarctica TaxID=1577474 RepID=A0A1G6GFH2_9ACTN|nr:TetR/AcrR family transcriptional regulator [Raineyella antarctica]SDB80505.1 DNA-binding transcriptional regulator, AcrR family [Raineyella antarctica]